MKSDRFYPLALLASLTICAAIATAFVGSTHHAKHSQHPVQAEISAPAQP